MNSYSIKFVLRSLTADAVLCVYQSVTFIIDNVSAPNFTGSSVVTVKTEN